MSEERWICPRFLAKNSTPAKLKLEYCQQFEVDPKYRYQTFLTVYLMDEYATCLLMVVSNNENYRFYDETAIFRQDTHHEAFQNYIWMLLNMFDSREISLVGFENIPMLESEFLGFATGWFQGKIS